MNNAEKIKRLKEFGFDGQRNRTIGAVTNGVMDGFAQIPKSLALGLHWGTSKLEGVSDDMYRRERKGITKIFDEPAFLGERINQYLNQASEQHPVANQAGQFISAAGAARGLLSQGVNLRKTGNPNFFRNALTGGRKASRGAYYGSALAAEAAQEYGPEALEVLRKLGEASDE